MIQNYNSASFKFDGVRYEFLLVLAEKGIAAAEFEIGRRNFYGIGGTSHNEKKAIEFLISATESGNADAETMLASAYFYGTALPQNKAKAIELFKDASEKGNPVAMRQLGAAYYYGDIVPCDKEKAFALFNKACDMKNFQAMFDLAICYRKGDGCPEDKNKALELLKEAAANGQADAVSLLKERGIEVPASEEDCSVEITDAFYGEDIFITDKKQYMVSLHYDRNIMTEPIVTSKLLFNDNAILSFTSVLEEIGARVLEDSGLAPALYCEHNIFESIVPKYWEKVASIYAQNV